MLATNKKQNDHVISLVTGGTNGIGRVIKSVLCERGDQVYTLSRRRINNAYHISVDMSSKEKMVEITKRLDGKNVNNLIFCHRYRGSSLKKEFLVSLNAVHHVIESLKNKFTSETSIVIISSKASRFIFDEQSFAYHSSRAALENLTKYYAVHLGVQGVRCNCVLPGTIIKPENEDFFNRNMKVTQLIKDITPLGRMGQAVDIAYLVEYLCSEKASFITGQSIFVDGGLSIVGQESIARRLKGLSI